MIKLDTLPPILTMDEKKQIYENWTKDSWKILAERNMRLAVKIALSFANTGIEDEELVCISIMGLVKAAQKFNPMLGYEFATFAVPVIKNEIRIELRNRRKRSYPSISLNAVVENGDGSCCEFGELIADEFHMDDEVAFSSLIMIIRGCLKKEKGRNKKIIMNYLNGIKQGENASICGVSQPQVSKIVKRFRNSIAEELRG